ncbi:hypothetical protein ACIPZF_01660 [Pseudomonas sp. NPDC089752]|uniref:hypothetical protein n=1 Tax=Pseudomonas sp. NPDC089752 TaxID=3364472 RepID=UPI00380F6F3C
MKLLVFVLFVACDVIFRMFLKRSLFENLSSKWRASFALIYFAAMMIFYMEVMRGKGGFDFSRDPLQPVGVWLVIILCGAMVCFHVWAFASRMNDTSGK